MKNSILDENEISELLSSIQPRPSQRFHRRMAEQSWVRKDHPSPRFRIHAQQLGILVGLAFLLVLLLSLATPTLKVVAQRLIQFFLPTISDQTVVQITLEETSSPADNFPLTISQAESLAGFDAHTPSLLPEGYSLTGASYHPERNAIVLDYHTEAPGQMLRILQRPSSEEYQQIGASALVETIQVDAVTGEYVTGAWTIPEVESAIEATELGKTPPLLAIWNPEAEIQMLRWVENEMLFEIIFSSGNPNQSDYLSKADLIALADSMR